MKHETWDIWVLYYCSPQFLIFAYFTENQGHQVYLLDIHAYQVHHQVVLMVLKCWPRFVGICGRIDQITSKSLLEFLAPHFTQTIAIEFSHNWPLKILFPKLCKEILSSKWFENSLTKSCHDFWIFPEQMICQLRDRTGNAATWEVLRVFERAL